MICFSISPFYLLSIVNGLSYPTFQNPTTPSTNSPSIQDVIFFPQMGPLQSEQGTVSSEQEYLDLGIPEEWVPVLQELGYETVEKLREVEKPGKLANDLNGFNKKNKLGMKELSPEEVEGWIANLQD